MGTSKRQREFNAMNTPDTYKIYQFASKDAAWEFMRACGAERLRCGFPTVNNTCEVNLTTFPFESTYDRLAGI
jgi:hypothetical protein